MRRYTPFLIFLALSIVIAPILAQDDCPTLVTEALDKLDTLCESTERNEACYANSSLYVESQNDVSEFEFDSEGDIEGVGKIRTLSMSALDEEGNAWGVVLMQLQASLPDTLPGENVTFILFGDVELVNAVDEDDTELQPMQAFYLRTGIGDAACEDAPESGLMIRTPEGQGEMTFSVNGVDVAVGSDVFLQAQPNDYLVGRVFDGSAAASTSFGETGGVAGTEFQIPLDGDLLPSGPPEPLRGYDRNNLNLPSRIFGQIREPLDDDQVELVDTRIQEGTPPCGDEDFLPDCSTLIRTLGGDKCPLNDEGIQDCDVERPPRWEQIGPPLRDQIAPVLGRPEERQRGEPSFAPIPPSNGQVSLPSSISDRIQRSPFGTRSGDDSVSETPQGNGNRLGTPQGTGRLPSREDEGTETPSTDRDRRTPTGDDEGTGSPLPGDNVRNPTRNNEATDTPTENGEREPLAPTGEQTPQPDNSTGNVATEESLPAGCEPGICTRDPAEACKCSLCGVQCPVDQSGGDTSTAPDGGGEINIAPAPNSDIGIAPPPTLPDNPTRQPPSGGR